MHKLIKGIHYYVKTFNIYRNEQDHLNLQSRNMSKYLQPINFAIAIFDRSVYMLQYQIVIVKFVCSKTLI